MANNIEVLVGEKTMIKVAKKVFNAGDPKVVSLDRHKALSLRLLYKTTESMQVIYTNLVRFSQQIGVTGQVMSRDGVYLPNARDSFVIIIPRGYDVLIRSV